MGIIYLLAPDAQLDLIANKWNVGRVAKGKDAHEIIRCRGTGALKAVRRVGLGALRNVQTDTRMYVLLHGVQDAASGPAAVAVSANRRSLDGR